MTTDERSRLYLSLLRGLAQSAQDQMCAIDEQHAWGPWVRARLLPDHPLLPMRQGNTFDTTIQTRSDRTCLNCGKEQFHDH